MIVTVKLFENDGTTEVTGALTQAFGVTWQTALSDPGWGQFSLPLSSAGAVEVIPGRFVQCLLDGTPYFHWQILRPPEVITVSTEEEYGQYLTAKGPGWIGGLSTAVIRPYGGISNPLVPQVRQWNFATPNFPNAGSWTAAVEINRADEINPDRYQLLTIVITVEDEADISETVAAPAPLGWYVPEAYWIWGNATTETIGRNYFRKSFTLAEQTLITIMATGDNFYTVYLEGTPVLGDNENEACWQEHREVTFTLPAGTYGIAAVVDNLEWPAAYVNPAGFLAAVIVPDAQGSVEANIIVTDDSWNSLDYPATEPGWTPGQILIDAISEAQANDTLPHVAVNFDGTDDSDSNPWEELINGWNQIPNFAIPIGASLFDLLTRLVDEEWLEYRSATATMTLEAYNPEAAGLVSGWEFEEGININELTFGEAEPVYNRLLIKWGSGYLEVENATAITANDGIVLEGCITVDASDYADAERLGQIALSETSNPQPSISLRFLAPEPWRQDTLSLLNRARPFEDFREGDILTIPDQAGDQQDVRLLSLSVTQMDDGHADISGELNRRIRIPDRERAELLHSLGMGVQGETRISIPLTDNNAVATRQGVP